MGNSRNKLYCFYYYYYRFAYLTVSTNCLIKSFTFVKEYLFIKPAYYLRVCVSGVRVYYKNIKHLYMSLYLSGIIFHIF